MSKIYTSATQLIGHTPFKGDKLLEGSEYRRRRTVGKAGVLQSRRKR